MNETVIQSEHPSPLQQAGIEQRDFVVGQVRVREIANLTLLRLRFLAAPPADEGFGAARSITDLPFRTGQCGGEDPVYLCLGPNEWLVICKSAASSQLPQPVTSAQQAVTYDLTDGLVVLRLTGAAAPWLLGKLSCLDFHAGTKHGRHCARTRLGVAEVTVHYHRPADDDWAFDLIADRSIAGYLWALLQASAPHANDLAQDSRRSA